jgi:hypothetical protein
MAENWFFQWNNNNRNRKEVAALIALHGWKYYGIYTAVREVIAQFDGEVDVKIVMSQLNLTMDDIQPLIDNKCYVFVIGLLSDTDIKNACEKRKIISDKRSAAGSKAMATRWNKKPEKKGRARVSNVEAAPDLFDGGHKSPMYNSDKKKVITNVTNSNSNSNDDTKVSSNTDKKDPDITIVIKKSHDIYNEWFKKNNGVDPIGSAAGNKSLKSICNYLLNQIKNSHPDAAPDVLEAETVKAFGTILKSNQHWGKYEKDKIRLQDILSNLTNIIANIKQSKNGRTIENGSADGGQSNGFGGSKVANSLSAIDAA